MFHRYGGCCYLTGKKLAAGEYDLDHVKALANGGEHRESNLAPIWRAKHIEKSAADRDEQAKTQRIHDKHFGIIKPAGRIKSRGFDRPRRKEARDGSGTKTTEPTDPTPICRALYAGYRGGRG